MKNKFLIKSAGRVGSHMVHYYLYKNDNCVALSCTGDAISRFRNQNFNMLIQPFKKYNICVHTHSFVIPDNFSKWDYILVKRKNKFKQAISHILANITKQYTIYSKIEITPFEVSFEQLNFLIKKINRIEQQFEKEQRHFKWRNSYTVYYEDFVDDLNYLKFIKYYKEDVTCDIDDRPISQKSIYDYATLILNYDELYELYKKTY